MNAVEGASALNAVPALAGGRRRWLILGVIGIAQLMVVLDLTVMNIALPSAQQALHFTTADRQWVVTAYSLAFGSLLLVGGKLGDLIGRRTTFLVGLVGFAAVSAVGGASVDFPMLVAARACQGVFAAVLVPSALALLTTTFTDPKDRARAFGVFGAIATAGGAIGLLLGGALTDYLSWRWTLYVNLAFAGSSAGPFARSSDLADQVPAGRPRRRVGVRRDVLPRIRLLERGNAWLARPVHLGISCHRRDPARCVRAVDQACD
jgi:MFS family permease